MSKHEPFEMPPVLNDSGSCGNQWKVYREARYFFRAHRDNLRAIGSAMVQSGHLTQEQLDTILLFEPTKETEQQGYWIGSELRTVYNNTVTARDVFNDSLVNLRNALIESGENPDTLIDQVYDISTSNEVRRLYLYDGFDWPEPPK